MASRLTRLETEILYTLWVWEIDGNKDGLQYKQVFELTSKRHKCTFDSIKKGLQRLRKRDKPHPPVEASEAPEHDWEGLDPSMHGSSGRTPNLWVLDPNHLVTMPESALILTLAHQWPQSCIRASELNEAANKAGITDDIFKERLPFLVENEYLSKRDTWTLFYTPQRRVRAEIDYLRKLAEHFTLSLSKVIPIENAPIATQG